MRVGVGHTFPGTKAIASATALCLLLTAATSGWAEAGFWQQRKSARSRQLQVAASPERGVLSLPDFQAVDASRIVTRAFSGETGRDPLLAPLEGSSLLKALPLAETTVREVHIPAGGFDRLIVHIQDVHGLRQAQDNIAKSLQHIEADARRRGAGPALVGLEGAAGPFLVDAIRSLGGAGDLDALTAPFYEKGILTGAEQAALTGPTAPELWGIEDAALYRRHVAAVKESFPREEAAKALLAGLEARLAEAKKETYSPALQAWDGRFRAYHAGTLPLGDYVQFLWEHAARKSRPQIDLFLKALAREKAIDFKRAESDRQVLVQSLSRRLDAASLKGLMDRAVDFRLGRLSYTRFHDLLTAVAAKAGMSVDRFPAFSAYVHYVAQVEKIDRAALLKEIDALEKDAAAAALAGASPDARRVHEVSTDLTGASKLFSRVMTPEDWTRHLARRQEARGLPARLGLEDGGFAEALALFERFYEAAEERNHALVDNLLAKAAARPAGAARVVTLVAGGFHTDGMTALLKKKGAAYVVLAPRFDDVGEHNYLDVFRQDKTPLARLFESEKVSLTAPLETPARPLNDGKPGAGFYLLAVQAVKELGAGLLVQESLQKRLDDLGLKEKVRVFQKGSMIMGDERGSSERGTAALAEEYTHVVIYNPVNAGEHVFDVKVWPVERPGARRVGDLWVEETVTGSSWEQGVLRLMGKIRIRALLWTPLVEGGRALLRGASLGAGLTLVTIGTALVVVGGTVTAALGSLAALGGTLLFLNALFSGQGKERRFRMAMRGLQGAALLALAGALLAVLGMVDVSGTASGLFSTLASSTHVRTAVVSLALTPFFPRLLGTSQWLQRAAPVAAAVVDEEKTIKRAAAAPSQEAVLLSSDLLEEDEDTQVRPAAAASKTTEEEAADDVIELPSDLLVRDETEEAPARPAATLDADKDFEENVISQVRPVSHLAEQIMGNDWHFVERLGDGRSKYASKRYPFYMITKPLTEESEDLEFVAREGALGGKTVLGLHVEASALSVRTPFITRNLVERRMTRGFLPGEERWVWISVDKLQDMIEKDFSRGNLISLKDRRPATPASAVDRARAAKAAAKATSVSPGRSRREQAGGMASGWAAVLVFILSAAAGGGTVYKISRAVDGESRTPAAEVAVLQTPAPALQTPVPAPVFQAPAPVSPEVVELGPIHVAGRVVQKTVAEPAPETEVLDLDALPDEKVAQLPVEAAVDEEVQPEQQAVQRRGVMPKILRDYFRNEFKLIDRTSERSDTRLVKKPARPVPIAMLNPTEGSVGPLASLLALLAGKKGAASSRRSLWGYVFSFTGVFLFLTALSYMDGRGAWSLLSILGGGVIMGVLSEKRSAPPTMFPPKMEREKTPLTLVPSSSSNTEPTTNPGLAPPPQLGVPPPLPKRKAPSGLAPVVAPARTLNPESPGYHDAAMNARKAAPFRPSISFEMPQNPSSHPPASRVLVKDARSFFKDHVQNLTDTEDPNVFNFTYEGALFWARQETVREGVESEALQVVLEWRKDENFPLRPLLTIELMGTAEEQAGVENVLMQARGSLLDLENGEELPQKGYIMNDVKKPSSVVALPNGPSMFDADKEEVTTVKPASTPSPARASSPPPSASPEALAHIATLADELEPTLSVPRGNASFTRIATELAHSAGIGFPEALALVGEMRFGNASPAEVLETAAETAVSQLLPPPLNTSQESSLPGTVEKAGTSQNWTDFFSDIFDGQAGQAPDSQALTVPGEAQMDSQAETVQAPKVIETGGRPPASFSGSVAAILFKTAEPRETSDGFEMDLRDPAGHAVKEIHERVNPGSEDEHMLATILVYAPGQTEPSVTLKVRSGQLERFQKKDVGTQKLLLNVARNTLKEALASPKVPEGYVFLDVLATPSFFYAGDETFRADGSPFQADPDDVPFLLTRRKASRTAAKAAGFVEAAIDTTIRHVLLNAPSTGVWQTLDGIADAAQAALVNPAPTPRGEPFSPRPVERRVLSQHGPLQPLATSAAGPSQAEVMAAVAGSLQKEQDVPAAAPSEAEVRAAVADSLQKPHVQLRRQRRGGLGFVAFVLLGIALAVAGFALLKNSDLLSGKPETGWREAAQVQSPAPEKLPVPPVVEPMGPPTSSVPAPVVEPVPSAAPSAVQPAPRVVKAPARPRPISRPAPSAAASAQAPEEISPVPAPSASAPVEEEYDYGIGGPVAGAGGAAGAPSTSAGAGAGGTASESASGGSAGAPAPAPTTSAGSPSEEAPKGAPSAAPAPSAPPTPSGSAPAPAPEPAPSAEEGEDGPLTDRQIDERYFQGTDTPREAVDLELRPNLKPVNAAKPAPGKDGNGPAVRKKGGPKEKPAAGTAVSLLGAGIVVIKGSGSSRAGLSRPLSVGLGILFLLVVPVYLLGLSPEFLSPEAARGAAALAAAVGYPVSYRLGSALANPGAASFAEVRFLTDLKTLLGLTVAGGILTGVSLLAGPLLIVIVAGIGTVALTGAAIDFWAGVKAKKAVREELTPAAALVSPADILGLGPLGPLTHELSDVRREAVAARKPADFRRAYPGLDSFQIRTLSEAFRALRLRNAVLNERVALSYQVEAGDEAAVADLRNALDLLSREGRPGRRVEVFSETRSAAETHQDLAARGIPVERLVFRGADAAAGLMTDDGLLSDALYLDRLTAEGLSVTGVTVVTQRPDRWISTSNIIPAIGRTLTDLLDSLKAMNLTAAHA